MYKILLSDSMIARTILKLSSKYQSFISTRGIRGDSNPKVNPAIEGSLAAGLGIIGAFMGLWSIVFSVNPFYQNWKTHFDVMDKPFYVKWHNEDEED